MSEDYTATKKLLSQAKKNHLAALRATPWSTKNVIEAHNKVKDYELGVQEILDLRTNLFPGGDPSVEAAPVAKAKK